jgi:hypothetical protein
MQFAIPAVQKKRSGVVSRAAHSIDTPHAGASRASVVRQQSKQMVICDRRQLAPHVSFRGVVLLVVLAPLSSFVSPFNFLLLTFLAQRLA